LFCLRTTVISTRMSCDRAAQPRTTRSSIYRISLRPDRSLDLDTKLEPERARVSPRIRLVWSIACRVFGIPLLSKLALRCAPLASIPPQMVVAVVVLGLLSQTHPPDSTQAGKPDSDSPPRQVTQYPFSLFIGWTTNPGHDS
jgi:hypothetical protein